MSDLYVSDSYTTYVIEPETQIQQPISFFRASDGSIRLGKQPIVVSPPQSNVEPQERPQEIPREMPHRSMARESALRRSQSFHPKAQSENQSITARNPAPRRNGSSSSSNRPDSFIRESTEKTTRDLQLNAAIYMNEQEEILTLMKAIMDGIKRLDQVMEQGMELLQENFKKDQDALAKLMKERTKQIKKHTDERRQTLQERLQELGQSQEEAKQSFIKEQQGAIGHYTKGMKKLLD